MAKEALEKKGYELVPFKIDEEEFQKYNDAFLAVVSNALLGELMNVLDDHYEERMSLYKMVTLLYRSPFLNFMAQIILRLTGNKRISNSLKGLKPKSKKNLDKDVNFMKNYLETMAKKWKDEKIDAVIMPPYIGCAFKNANAGDMGAMLDYTIMWNGLHFPSGLVPVTQV